MLDILVWVILFLIFSGIVLVVHYWFELFNSKDRYGREEILNIPQIIQDQLMHLTEGRDRMLQFTGIGVGIGIGWVLTLAGGFFSPNVGPEPDWASAQMPNYFFQSALFVLILHLAYPSFRDLAHDSGGSSGIGMRILNTEIALFFGLTCTLAAMNLAVWGVHHQTNFLFALINAVLCLGYAGFRLGQKQEALEKEEDTDYSEAYGRRDDFEDDLADQNYSGGRREAEEERSRRRVNAGRSGGASGISDDLADDLDADFAAQESDASIVPQFEDDLDDFQEPEELEASRSKRKTKEGSREDRITDLEMPEDNRDY